MVLTYLTGVTMEIGVDSYTNGTFEQQMEDPEIIIEILDPFSTDNMRKEKNISKNLSYTALIMVILSFILFLLKGNPLYLFITLMFVPLYNIYYFNKKMYYIFKFFTLSVQGLILVYTFQFRFIYLNGSFDNFLFYVSTIILIFFILIYVRCIVTGYKNNSVP